MRLPVCAWLLMAALCVTGPALGQEDEGRVQARPADESSGEEGTSEDDAVDGRAREGERPRARGLREKPIWEIGVVGGGGWLPDYPAADENHLQGIVLPYVIYRGDFLRVGDGGVARGVFVDVPWLELNVGCCQSNANQSPKHPKSRCSGRKLTPLSQGGRAVLLEDISAVEVAVLIEVVVYRGVNGSKLLQGLDVPEPSHRALSSSERLM